MRDILAGGSASSSPGTDLRHFNLDFGAFIKSLGEPRPGEISKQTCRGLRLRKAAYLISSKWPSLPHGKPPPPWRAGSWWCVAT
jgi:hypothetical protein